MIVEVNYLPKALDKTLRQVLRVFYIDINSNAIIETVLFKIAVKLSVT